MSASAGGSYYRSRGLLARYRDRLPVTDKTPHLTLGEGGTPLVRLPRLGAELGVELYAKTEGCNPTGSFKDRGMVLAVAKAVEEGSRAVICASTGNTSASAAAYAARAGIRSIVVIPSGKIALGKLAQAVMLGAEIVSIEGNFDAALRIVRGLCETEAITLVNSVNPYRIEGQKTAAFEICEALGRAPDFLAIPVGNAGNITAYWRGFREWGGGARAAVGEAAAAAAGAGPLARGLPRLHGFEAEGAAAIVRGHPIAEPETIATAIRIGNPASWQGAVAAAQESGGVIDCVSDAEILEAYRRLARTEGVFAEPASAVSIAGAIKHVASGQIPKGSTVVAVLTGNGLKDPNAALEAIELGQGAIGHGQGASRAGGLVTLPADLAAIRRHIRHE